MPNRITTEIFIDRARKIHEEKEPGYHENKRQLCKDAGITLIEVWDSQWKTNAETIKKEISEHLQKIREKL